MLIVGAKGFASELLNELVQLNQTEDIVFFDDVSTDLPDLIFERYKVFRDLGHVKNYFISINNQFTIGIGSPILRKKMADKFIEIGGDLTSLISKNALIGYFGNNIDNGCNIMSGSNITSNVSIGRGCLINVNTSISHDSLLEEFVEVSPGVNIAGHCKIKSFTTIGANATILPKITIGHNVMVGAGSVVTKDIPDNCMVYGVPAVIKKSLEKLCI
jgi:sugar O-acyltransferase (sialic acid O-acetyltransferase NeuD family)